MFRPNQPQSTPIRSSSKKARTRVPFLFSFLSILVGEPKTDRKSYGRSWHQSLGHLARLLRARLRPPIPAPPRRPWPPAWWCRAGPGTCDSGPGGHPWTRGPWAPGIPESQDSSRVAGETGNPAGCAFGAQKRGRLGCPPFFFRDQLCLTLRI